MRCVRLRSVHLGTFALALLLALETWSAADEAALPSPTPSLFTRVLALQHIQEPEIDDQAMTTAFTAVVDAVRIALAASPTAREKIDILNQTLLTDRSVSYLSNQYWRDSTLAACLLRHRGNCLSTSTLYCLVGEALHLPIHLVVVPGHAFVRWDEPGLARNIETTSQGREIADDEYLYTRGTAIPPMSSVWGGGGHWMPMASWPR